MAKDPRTLPELDHFLQADIISRLAETDHALRFSELKEAGIDNSLFMYHANKLINRGLVEKDDDGFKLTRTGARWANEAGVFHSFKVATPRPLVQFVIQDPENNILLAVRKGQLRKHLNDYLLPGNIYRYGSTLEENVQMILGEIFAAPPGIATMPLTTADVIHTMDGGLTHHVIAFLFSVRVSVAKQQVLEHPLFTTEWVQRDAITPDNPLFSKSMLLPELFGRADSLKEHETFILKSQ
jgi:ADP-ribose pyrophosphatase YjhB (NUDIX family)